MPIIVATTAILTVLGIAKEEWDKLPASKKRRIRKAIEEKDYAKARQIYAENPHPLKLKETEEFVHIRVKNPKTFHAESIKVISLGNGIKATIGCPTTETFSGERCQDGTRIQKLMFEKPKWNKEKAKDWVRKHPKVKARRKT